jgi:ComF family protein
MTEPARNCTDIDFIIDGIRAPFLFRGLVRQTIHELKYRNLRAAAPFLARELAGYLQELPLTADVIVPVPLHKKRLKERGYNQSELITRHLSALTGIPHTNDGLVRLKHTLSLARSASREARRESVAGAFAIGNREAIEGRNILLVDDVSTTGATLDACAAMLKKAGARTVWGLATALEL